MLCPELEGDPRREGPLHLLIDGFELDRGKKFFKLPEVDSSLILVVSVFAGFFTSLIGLGGGIFLVPALTVFLGLDIKIVAPAALFSVVATSLGASGHYLRRGDAQLSIAAYLEPWALAGAVAGAYFSTGLSASGLYLLFALFLAGSAWSMWKSPHAEEISPKEASPLSRSLQLSYELEKGNEKQTKYICKPLWGGFALVFAGILSALLGIGGGVVKVLVMNRAMGIPLRTATATSNVMIGLTASAGAAIYLVRNKIDLDLAVFMSFGVLIGSWVGGKIAHKMKTQWLKSLFIAALLLAAVEMTRKSFL